MVHLLFFGSITYDNDNRIKVLFLEIILRKYTLLVTLVVLPSW
jgi:hypothetical protein